MEAVKEPIFGTEVAYGMRMIPKLRIHACCIAQRKRAMPHSTMKPNHSPGRQVPANKRALWT